MAYAQAITQVITHIAIGIIKAVVQAIVVTGPEADTRLSSQSVQDPN